MEKFTIEKIEGRWTVNGKQFNELSPNEVIALDNFIKDYSLDGNYEMPDYSNGDWKQTFNEL